MKETFTKQVFRLTLYIVLLTAVNNVFAQQTVRGTVLSEADEGMPGVNVVLKGTTTGTTTDADGKFSISVPGPESARVVTSDTSPPRPPVADAPNPSAPGKAGGAAAAIDPHAPISTGTQN